MHVFFISFCLPDKLGEKFKLDAFVTICHVFFQQIKNIFLVKKKNLWDEEYNKEKVALSFLRGSTGTKNVLPRSNRASLFLSETDKPKSLGGHQNLLHFLLYKSNLFRPLTTEHLALKEIEQSCVGLWTVFVLS